jgi:putative ABC transport system substrate-binding protein
MIPIVFAPAGDAVHAGLVQSLAHPEGNLTGVSINTWVLNQKRLEILKETFQRIKRVAILGNGSNPANLGQWDQFKYSGQALGLDLLPFMIGGIAKLVVDFDRIATSGVDALAVLPDATFDTAREQIVALAAKHRLATMYEHRAFVEAGGLMSYGPNLDQISYRAATVVDKLLKGAKPADLPVEQPTSYELIINLKAVKALNITIEEAVMSRADEVIE